MALLLLWGTSDVAEARGRGLAEDLEANLLWLPRAQVHSYEPLVLDVPGVTTHELVTVVVLPDDASLRVRYGR